MQDLEAVMVAEADCQEAAVGVTTETHQVGVEEEEEEENHWMVAVGSHQEAVVAVVRDAVW